MRTTRKQQCSKVLRNTFGVSGFRPGQEQAADALLDGRDLLCILPTGAGKSLCWQLPALMMDELTVVISPLIVLMHDQVRHLRERGIPSVHLDSLMTPAERADALNQLTRGQAKIAFLAPERLNHPEIHALCQQRPPAMVVVDEAHCVVQWGDAFRPSYQQMGQFVSSLPPPPGAVRHDCNRRQAVAARHCAVAGAAASEAHRHARRTPKSALQRPADGARHRRNSPRAAKNSGQSGCVLPTACADGITGRAAEPRRNPRCGISCGAKSRRAKPRGTGVPVRAHPRRDGDIRIRHGRGYS